MTEKTSKTCIYSLQTLCLYMLDFWILIYILLLLLLLLESENISYFSKIRTFCKNGDFVKDILEKN